MSTGVFLHNVLQSLLSWVLLGRCGRAVGPPLSPVWCHRRLTDRQRALMMSYAEDEADVDGTVNGVTNTASGERGSSCPCPGSCCGTSQCSLSLPGEQGEPGSP